MTNLLSKLTFSLLCSGLALGCVESAPDDRVADDHAIDPQPLGSTIGIFEVVRFDAYGLSLASSAPDASCGAAPCNVAAHGLASPLDSRADGYLVGGALSPGQEAFDIDRVWRGTRTWGNGSGDVFTLSRDEAQYQLCRVYPVLSAGYIDAGATMANPGGIWQGGARFVVPQLAQLGIDELSRDRVTGEPAPAGGRCTKLGYVVTTIDGQEALADALTQGVILVRATPAIDGQGEAFAHLGMVYVDEMFDPHAL